MSADSKRDMAPLESERLFSVEAAMPVGAKLNVGRGVVDCVEDGTRFLRLVLEKDMLNGVPIEAASGLSGVDTDICRCLRLIEDLFFRTCGFGGTLMPPVEFEVAPSTPLGTFMSPGVAGDPVRTDSGPGLTDGIGEPD